jgi:hypothetical protein
MEKDGSVQSTWEQQRHIINLDETNFSLDGSDGGQGGCPSQSIAVAGVNRPGTAINKSSVSSTLMCGSNAAGEPLPLHIMFSSEANKKSNYTVNVQWIFNFGHDSHRSIPSSVTVNPAGGTDSRVLSQVLSWYQLGGPRG